MQRFAGVRPVRSSGAATLPPAREFGPAASAAPAAPAAAAHDFARVAVSAPVQRAARRHPVYDRARPATAVSPLGQPGGMKGRGTAVIQRVIKLNGQQLSDDEVAQHGADATERTILANWAASDVEHRFTKARHLKKAVASVKTKPTDASDLYKKANLKFLTKADNRLPTLYFKSGDDSGRLRQQHGKGPKVGSETNKKDYFFENSAHLDTFEAAAKDAKANDRAFDPTALNLVHSTAATDDYHHTK